ncbi:MAG: N-glycosidase YbiA, partial [Pseudomonadota bacterium]|nr:N-glycosidase YbiA [Pseudomonadota bacterium]
SISKIEACSVKSPFWGVVPDGDGFRGENRLGELLMKLRDELIDSDNESLMVVEAPPHLGLKFLGYEIGVIDRSDHLIKGGTRFSERVAEVRP